MRGDAWRYSVMVKLLLAVVSLVYVIVSLCCVDFTPSIHPW